MQKSLTILNTRPGPAGIELGEKINAAGFQALNFPTIVFTDAPDPSLLQQQIAGLSEYQWLIFISPQSVYASANLIHAAWPQIPATVNLAAVGAGTAKALEAANFPQALHPKTDWNSEGLLDLPEFQQVAGTKIAIVSGKDGREWLADTLTARGASVTKIIAYVRSLPTQSVTDYKQLLQSNKIDVVISTSGDGLKNLITLLASVLPELQKVALIVISPKMQKQAQELGFQKIFLAKNASHSAIMESLSQISVSQDQKGFPMENQIDNAPVNERTMPEDNLPPKRRCSKWANLGILCSAFAVIVLFSASFVAYNRLITANQEIVSLTTRLNTKIQNDQANIANLEKTVSETQQNVQGALANQQQVIGELRTSQQGKKESWSIAEAQYLTNLANDNLQIGDNIPLVISLLQTADQNIRDLGDANVLPIRKALASDIAALQGVAAVDLAGVYAKLAAVNGEIDKLPLPNKRPGSGLATTTTDNQNLPWWRRGLQQSWNALRQIVIVRYNKPGERPFIPPEQQDFLYQNLHASLQQALSAVVHRQPEIYRTSLQQASAWIKQYFLTDSPITQATVESLTQLQAVDLRPALPTIANSIQAFHDYFINNNPTNTTANQS